MTRLRALIDGGRTPASITLGLCRWVVARAPATGAGDWFVGGETLDGSEAEALIGGEGGSRGWAWVFEALERAGEIYQDALAMSAVGGTTGRRAGGVFFTPRWLAESVVSVAARARGDAAAGVCRVCDPSCGAGRFLIAAGESLAGRTCREDAAPAARLAAAGCLFGVDVDPVAVALCRAVVWAWAGGGAELAGALERQIVVGDALLMERSPGGQRFGMVVGNPPFLSQLSSSTADGRARAARVRERFGGLVRGYADEAVRFMLLGREWAEPGGVSAMILPVSVLSSRDAGPVRESMLGSMTLEGIWVSDGHAFDAGVETCAVVLRRMADEPTDRPAMVKRWRGPGFEPMGESPAPLDAPGGTWSALVADVLGVPPVRVIGVGTVGDLARATADFRDQYYGLRGVVRESGGGRRVDGPRLVTTSMVDPAWCAWGERPARFDGSAWRAPVVEAGALTPAMASWANARLVPKVLVATQTRVIEAVVDECGAWLPLVPLISVVPRDAGDVWRVASALSSPVVSAWAAARCAGAGMSRHAIKLSASQVLRAPLPADHGAWSRAAELFREASGSAGEDERGVRLVAFGRASLDAYGVPEAERAPLMAWWARGLTPRRGSGRPVGSR